MHEKRTLVWKENSGARGREDGNTNRSLPVLTLAWNGSGNVTQVLVSSSTSRGPHTFSPLAITMEWFMMSGLAHDAWKIMADHVSHRTTSSDDWSFGRPTPTISIGVGPINRQRNTNSNRHNKPWGRVMQGIDSRFDAKSAAQRRTRHSLVGLSIRSVSMLFFISRAAQAALEATAPTISNFLRFLLFFTVEVGGRPFSAHGFPKNEAKINEQGFPLTACFFNWKLHGRLPFFWTLRTRKWKNPMASRWSADAHPMELASQICFFSTADLMLGFLPLKNRGPPW